MIGSSREYRDKVNSGADLLTYADIMLSNGKVLNLTYADIMINGCKISDSTTESGEFSIGNAIGKSLNIRIANFEGQFSEYDFYKAIVRPYIGLILDDGTVEKIRKGKYYVNVPESPGNVITMEAVDSMVLFDQPYTTSHTSYPATLQKILTEACLECGVKVGFGQFDNYSFEVKEKPDGVTYRQVISYAAQVAGYNARINNDDALELVWYNTEILNQENYDGGFYSDKEQGEIIDGGLYTDGQQKKIIDGGLYTDNTGFYLYSFKTLTVSTDDVVITGVKVTNEEKEYLFGNTGYAINIEDNPFVSGKELEVADYLGARMTGIRFRPFTGQILSNPLYEPFDIGYITDIKGNTYRTIINSVEFTIGSFTTIACQADAPLRNSSSYRSEAARAVVEARRSTEKKLSDYDKVVQQMNELAGNTMGFHTTYEELPDGSRITYLHDKPGLKDSVTVYKQTIDGFFISTDGGKTYTAGFDKNGNAVVNILAAIGIMFDWAKGGMLTLGGDAGINGIASILNALGKEVARLDQNGIKAIEGTIGGWNIGNDFLETETAIIRSFSGNDKKTRSTMNNASFKVWVNDLEKCYMGRGDYNGRGSSDCGLLLLYGNKGVELDANTGNANIGGDVNCSGNVNTNALYCAGNASFSGDVYFEDSWTGTFTINGIRVDVKSGIITNVRKQ